MAIRPVPIVRVTHLDGAHELPIEVEALLEDAPSADGYERLAIWVFKQALRDARRSDVVGDDARRFLLDRFWEDGCIWREASTRFGSHETVLAWLRTLPISSRCLPTTPSPISGSAGSLP